jgi:alkylhydroperoxidase family enzyme
MSMPRLDLPPEEAMTPEQKEAVAEVVSGLRGRVPAPMIAWLRNPELARRGQKLGELLRYQTTLPPRLSELAILVCARHWTSHHEWTAHKREALKAGLEPAIIEAIAARRAPDFPMRKPRWCTNSPPSCSPPAASRPRSMRARRKPSASAAWSSSSASSATTAWWR